MTTDPFKNWLRDRKVTESYAAEFNQLADKIMVLADEGRNAVLSGEPVPRRLFEAISDATEGISIMLERCDDEATFELVRGPAGRVATMIQLGMKEIVKAYEAKQL